MREGMSFDRAGTANRFREHMVDSDKILIMVILAHSTTNSCYLLLDVSKVQHHD